MINQLLQIGADHLGTSLTAFPNINSWWDQRHSSEYSLLPHGALDHPNNNVKISDEVISNAYGGGILAHAFLAGYQGALRHLFPQHSQYNLLSFCVSEKTGNGPRSIKALLKPQGENYVLDGEKTFVTCADITDGLLVLAELENNSDLKEGKNNKLLRLILVDRSQQGVDVKASKPTAFVPEINRGILTLDNVAIDSSCVLSGEAHEQYSKPFSVLEGMYIRLASLSFLYRVACSMNIAKERLADILQQIVIMKTLLDNDPLSPETQIVLSSSAKHTGELVGDISKGVMQAKCFSEEFITMWQRDQIVFYMDSKLREKRLSSAWSIFGF